MFNPYGEYEDPHFGRYDPNDPSTWPQKFRSPQGHGLRPPTVDAGGGGNGEYTQGLDYETETGDKQPEYPGPNGTEDQKHAWKQWVQRKEAWTQDQLAGGHAVRMKKSDWNMRNAYGDTFANIDVLGHRVWDTRTYTDPTTGKEVKGGRWVPMDDQTRQDVNAWTHRFNDTPEGQRLSQAWGGDAYLGSKALENVQRYQGGIDPRYHVYWNRGSAPMGDYEHYQFWDQYGRPTAMPQGWTPSGGGMDPNHYDLNTKPGSVYPNPQNQFDPYAAYGQSSPQQQSSPQPSTTAPVNTSAPTTPPPPSPTGTATAVQTGAGGAWGIPSSPVSSQQQSTSSAFGGVPTTTQPQVPGVSTQQQNTQVPYHYRPRRQPRYSPFRMDDRAYGNV